MYKIMNFIYQSKGSRNIYEKDMYNSMWKKRKFGINIQTTDRWKQKMCILVRSEKHVRRTQLCFFENWVILSAKHGFLRPNDIVLEKL